MTEITRISALVCLVVYGIGVLTIIAAVIKEFVSKRKSGDEEDGDEEDGDV